jgi:hypothetical protein
VTPRRRALVLASGAALGASLVAPAASLAAPPATHCRPDEAVVYTCTFGPKTASVCATPAGLSYRYGRLGSPELEVTGDGAGGPARSAVIVGGGGGRQDSLRFASAGRNYVVYSATYGTLTADPGRRESGVVVFRGYEVAHMLGCPLRGQQQKIALPPATSGAVQDEADPEFQAWF